MIIIIRLYTGIEGTKQYLNAQWLQAQEHLNQDSA